MAIIRFPERAIQLFVAKQNSEFAPAVNDSPYGTIFSGQSKEYTLKAASAAVPTLSIALNDSPATIRATLLSKPDVITNFYFADSGNNNTIILFYTGTGTSVTWPTDMGSISSDYDTVTAATATKNRIVGKDTRFKYLETEKDLLGEATKGVYIDSTTTTTSVQLGRISKVLSQTVLELEAEVSASGVSTTFTTYRFALGTKNAIPVMNPTYSLETTSEAFMYSGSEKDRDETTVITDKYSKIDFETFVPALSDSISALTLSDSTPISSIDDIPAYLLLSGAGMTPTVGTNTITFTNSALADTFLTVEVRRSSPSAGFSKMEKVFTTTGARLTVDFDGVIGSKGKLKWSLQGNLKAITDKSKIIMDSAVLEAQKKAIAGTISSSQILTSQLDVHNIETYVTFLDSLPANKTIKLAGLTYTSTSDTTASALLGIFSKAKNGMSGNEILTTTGGEVGKYIATFSDITLTPSAAVAATDTTEAKAAKAATVSFTFAGLSVSIVGASTSNTTTLNAHNVANSIYLHIINNRASGTKYTFAAGIITISGTYDTTYTCTHPTSVSYVKLYLTPSSVITSTAIPSGITAVADRFTIIAEKPTTSTSVTGVLQGYNMESDANNTYLRIIPVYPNVGEVLSVAGDAASLGITSVESTEKYTPQKNGIKNVGFDKLSAPNLTGLEYTRFLSTYGDGWSKNAVPSDVTITISEEQANADYNPDKSLEKPHSLYLKWASGSGSVLISFEKLQLVKVTNSKVANFSGQDLAFRNIGNTSITLSYSA